MEIEPNNNRITKKLLIHVLLISAYLNKFGKADFLMKNIRLHFIVDLDENKSSSPSLGIGYLSSYIKNKLRNVRISLSFLSDDIISDIDRIKPDIIGISCTSRYFTYFKQLAQKIKEKFNIPIIWGGVHISISPNELPIYADVGVIGEGEETLEELLLNFVDNQFVNLKNIKGIVYSNNNKIIINEKRTQIKPLDIIPYPDWDLLRVKWDGFKRAVMLTSRGCPYKCCFCASSLFWEKTRLNSAEYIVECIKLLTKRYDVQEILIYDDLFTINKKRLSKIAELIDKEPRLKNIRYECLSRIDTFDEIVASILKKIGVYRISFGIESGSQKTLNYLKNETITLKQVKRTISLAKANGFEIVASFIIGSPYESAKEIIETFNFIEKLELDSLQISIATPFPGTKLWEDGKKIDKISSDEWSDEYYALFHMNLDLIKILRNKKLLTQIDKEEFLNLLDRAILLTSKINLKPNKLKRLLRILKYNPQNFPRKILNNILYYYSHFTKKK